MSVHCVSGWWRKIHANYTCSTRPWGKLQSCGHFNIASFIVNYHSRILCWWLYFGTMKPFTWNSSWTLLSSRFSLFWECFGFFVHGTFITNYSTRDTTHKHHIWKLVWVQPCDTGPQTKSWCQNFRNSKKSTLLKVCFSTNEMCYKKKYF